jgi:hypothetical protein
MEHLSVASSAELKSAELKFLILWNCVADDSFLAFSPIFLVVSHSQIESNIVEASISSKPSVFSSISQNHQASGSLSLHSVSYCHEFQIQMDGVQIWSQSLLEDLCLVVTNN